MPEFQIDHNKICSILADAYTSLLQHRDDVMAAFAKVPEQLATDEDIEFARGVVVELDEARAAARKARLSDQKPFKDASSRVQEFFDEIEKPLQNALRIVLERVADMARSRRANFPGDHSTPAEPVVTAGDTPIVTNSPSAKVLGTEIELIWSVKNVDRATLDLEKLRNYLTESSLIAACRKHLKEHGSEKIKGVWYEEVAQRK